MPDLSYRPFGRYRWLSASGEAFNDLSVMTFSAEDVLKGRAENSLKVRLAGGQQGVHVGCLSFSSLDCRTVVEEGPCKIRSFLQSRQFAPLQIGMEPRKVLISRRFLVKQFIFKIPCYFVREH